MPTEINQDYDITNRRLISLVWIASRMRPSDAGSAAFYHKAFFGTLISDGANGDKRSSPRRGAEPELMAVMVAKWNSRVFCIGSGQSSCPSTG